MDYSSKTISAVKRLYIFIMQIPKLQPKVTPQLFEERRCHEFQNQHHAGPRDSSHEALVQRDTRWINFLRILLIGSFVIVAIGLSLATHQVLTKLEHNEFRNNYNRIATQITYGFIYDITYKVWTTRIAASALQTFPSAHGDFLDLKSQLIYDMAIGAQSVAPAEGIQWSPLLWNRAEQENWQDYAREAIEANSNDTVTSSVCYVCGEGMKVGSPNSSVTLPGYGTFPCSTVEKGGLAGLVPEEDCSFLQQVMLASSCDCLPAPSIQGRNAGSAVADQIFWIENGKHVNDDGPFPLSPIWKGAPQPPNQALLFNQMRDTIRRKALMSMINTKLPTLAETRHPDSMFEELININVGFPKSTIFYPVFGNGVFNQTVVGSISLDLVWNWAFGISEQLPLNSLGVTMVIESNFGQQFTYQITSYGDVSLVGLGDLHDSEFDSMMTEATFGTIEQILLKAAPFPSEGNAFPESALLYNLRVYPSDSFKSQFVTNTPWIYSLVVASIFAFTSAMFILYDALVRRRQSTVMESAVQTNALLTSLFPDFIKTRLMGRVNNTLQRRRPSLFGTNANFLPLHFGAPNYQLKPVLGNSMDMSSAVLPNPEPIADFFPNVTVIFADISGFTAWSSEREPTQVFQLLETVYRKFDAIAEKHGVFKVETIGDCYVAVTGLPEPQADHAVRMAQFAHEIILHMHEAAIFLESQLGPGTGGLSIRVGLHSGSVTGGVLRGDRARFQLFGDTMNTAARMQSTGVINRIQVSESTAGLLTESGCGHWVEKRDFKVAAKGKGEMQTFWVNVSTRDDFGEERHTDVSNTISESELSGCLTF